MDCAKRIGIAKAENGYLVQEIDNYANFRGEPKIFTNFEDAVEFMAEQLGEARFAATVKTSQVFATALSDFVTVAIAPKLQAIESRLNPGAENVVGLGE